MPPFKLSVPRHVNLAMTGNQPHFSFKFSQNRISFFPFLLGPSSINTLIKVGNINPSFFSASHTFPASRNRHSTMDSEFPSNIQVNYPTHTRTSDIPYAGRGLFSLGSIAKGGLIFTVPDPALSIVRALFIYSVFTLQDSS